MASKWMDRAVTVTAWMVMGMGTVQGAEKVRWEELEKRVEQAGELRSASVVTRDGRSHHSKRVEINSNQIVLFNHSRMEIVPRQEVARVEIRKRKHYSQHVFENIVGPLGLPVLGAAIFLLDPEPGHRFSSVVAGFALGTVLAPPLLAYGVVSTPVFLAADSVAFLMPSKKFEIVP